MSGCPPKPCHDNSSCQWISTGSDRIRPLLNWVSMGLGRTGNVSQALFIFCRKLGSLQCASCVRDLRCLCGNQLAFRQFFEERLNLALFVRAGEAGAFDAFIVAYRPFLEDSGSARIPPLFITRNPRRAWESETRHSQALFSCHRRFTFTRDSRVIESCQLSLISSIAWGLGVFGTAFRAFFVGNIHKRLGQVVVHCRNGQRRFSAH